MTSGCDAQDDLRSTLSQIAELERKNNLLGTRFAVRGGGSVYTPSGAKFVLETTKRMVNLFGRIDKLPKSKRAEPPEIRFR